MNKIKFALLILFSLLFVLPVFSQETSDISVSSELSESENSNILFFSISNDNKHSLTGYEDGTIKINDLTSGTEIGSFHFNPDITKSASFTADGNKIFILLDSLTAGIYDFNGNLQEKIKLQYASKMKQTSSDKDDEEDNIDDTMEVVQSKLRYKNVDDLDLGLKLGVAPKPYAVDLSFTANYLSYRSLRGFYYGAGFDVGIGFPKKSFPYIYETYKGPLPKPKIFELNTYGTVGVCVYPFTANIELFTDFSIGYTGSFLWNGSLKEYNVTSDWYSCLFTAVRVGAGFKGIKAWVAFDYQPLFGVCLDTGVAYEIKMPF